MLSVVVRDIRMLLLLKFVICPTKSNGDVEECSSVAKRRRVSKRTGCKARIIFKFMGNLGYAIKEFEEKHNHCMSSVLAKQFLKVNRNITPAHQQFIANCARANIGTSKCFNLYKEIAGDYSDVGATNIDFKNFRRDIKAFILGVDGQMIVHNLLKKKELCPAFAFEYAVDENEQLSRIFWADPVARKNYTAFGDVVSFDATYQTNRYSMVFTPFTGVDNHKKCITFGAGLLLKEDVDSYVWLFEKFKNAMGTEPKVIVTDEDPAMKVAIPRVFKQARHRFCMWHIMCKVGDKVGPSLSKNEAFMMKLNSIVWSCYLQPAEFENEWRMLMEEYDLVNHSWFVKMFESRRFWIPAYFRDVFMGGLLRTTSRSESENNLFSRFTSPQSSLVEFFMNFDSALASQRYSNAKNISDNEGSIPQFKTPLQLERHASNVYTLTVFYEVQREICASCFTCRVVNVREEGGSLYYEIKDAGSKIFSVVHSVTEQEATCSCKMFEMVGLLCRHIFVVFKDLNLEKIPLKYVINRWTKDASLGSRFEIEGVIFDQCADKDKKKVLLNKLWTDIQCCINLAERNMDQLVAFSEVIDEQKQLLMTNNNQLSAKDSKQAVIESFCGSTELSDISVLPPKQAKNKGSGKRIKGGKEVSLDKTKKQKRLCRNCNVLAHHDSRNCPLGKDD